ncbi:olfactory receptor 10A7-like [Bufo bufo]|uniref:olfactory receptor 10A7-like n=1 Tax=Bufo bufo TaxID=8384 RepID=UPI001ABDF380|nr:olfactory receptor 10A7-like [Bufo bufo]
MCVENQTSPTELVLLGFGQLHLVKPVILSMVLLIYLIILAGNFLIIILITTSPRLSSPMYFFLCNLSSCEIIFTANIMPNMIYVMWSDGGIISLSGCITQFYVYSSSGSAECLLLTVMAFDRYIAIYNPLRYSSVMNFKTCCHLVVWAWLSGFIGMFIIIITISNLQFCGSDIVDHFFCDLEPILHLSPSDTSLVEIEVLVYAMVMGLLPFLLIILSYVVIFCTIFRIPSNIGRYKAFSTCSSHLASVCMYFGTILILYLVPSRQRSLEINKILSLCYTVLTPLLNPIIYSLRNQEMRACLESVIYFIFPVSNKQCTKTQ